MIYRGVRSVPMTDPETGVEHVVEVLHLDRDAGRPDDEVLFEVHPADARRLGRDYRPGQVVPWQALAWLRPRLVAGGETWPDASTDV